MAKQMTMIIWIAGFFCVGLAHGQVLSDDWQTLALWHMDSSFLTTSRAWINDDDALLVGRNNHLAFGNNGSSNTNNVAYPTLTSGNGGYDGEALLFDGVDDMCYTAYQDWPGSDGVRIELWFKHAAVAGEQTVLSVNGGVPWELRISGAGLYFYAWFKNPDGTSAGYKRAYRTYVSDAWNHVIAMVDDENVSLDVNGVVSSTPRLANTTLYDTVNYICVGCKQIDNRHYDGLIDEVKISDPTIEIGPWQQPYADDYNTFLLLHCNEILEQSPRRTPDDDTWYPGRALNTEWNLDGILVPESDAGQTYTGPEMVNSFMTEFGQCVQFDGSCSIRVEGVDQYDDLGIDPNNFRIELWALNEATKVDDNSEYFIVYQADTFRFSLGDLSDGSWGLRYVTYGNGGSTAILDASIANPSVWHHYAMEFDQGLMSLYVDGQLAGQKTAVFTFTDSPIRSLYIGSDHRVERGFLGRLDEFRISRAVPFVPECGLWGYSPADFNRDCYVNTEDLLEIATRWLLDCRHNTIGPCL